MIIEELAICAKINFENLEKANPSISKDPIYMIAKAQLDSALGDPVSMKKLEEYAKLAKSGLLPK